MSVTITQVRRYAVERRPDGRACAWARPERESIAAGDLWYEARLQSARLRRCLRDGKAEDETMTPARVRAARAEIDDRVRTLVEFGTFIVQNADAVGNAGRWFKEEGGTTVAPSTTVPDLM